ncbi:MAG: lyase family protein, partial [Rhodospirillales bacterium]
RLSEELVLWCSSQFGFAQLSDAFSTGSSIMPQKRNPDAAELTRAKAGRIIGALNTLLVVMKGLPLAYGKDTQEDKEPVFDAADNLALCVAATAGMMRDVTFDKSRLRACASSGHATATDLADWLVRELGMPFRRAHYVTGAVVRLAEAQSCDLAELSLVDFQSIEPGINKDIFTVLSIDNSVRSRTSYGGTAPSNVRTQAATARQLLKKGA